MHAETLHGIIPTPQEQFNFFGENVRVNRDEKTVCIYEGDGSRRYELAELIIGEELHERNIKLQQSIKKDIWHTLLKVTHRRIAPYEYNVYIAADAIDPNFSNDDYTIGVHALYSIQKDGARANGLTFSYPGRMNSDRRGVLFEDDLPSEIDIIGTLNTFVDTFREGSFELPNPQFIKI